MEQASHAVEGDSQQGPAAVNEESGDVVAPGEAYGGAEGYDANGYNYEDYYNYQQQQGEAGQEASYAGYEQGGQDPAYDAQYYQGYDATQQFYADPSYYQQQEHLGEAESGYNYAYDPNDEQAYAHQYEYHLAAQGQEGQDYSYYYGAEGAMNEYAVGPEMIPAGVHDDWGYAPQGRNEQQYVDQLADAQAADYYYDEAGNPIMWSGEQESPTNAFNQESYWAEEAYNVHGDEEETSPEVEEGSPQDTTNAEGSSPAEVSAVINGTETPETPDGLDKPPRKVKTPASGSRAASPSKKKKTKKERIEQRQAMLEKEEEERLKALEASGSGVTGNSNAPGNPPKIGSKSRGSPKKLSFMEREKAKLQLKVRIAKAIRRKRMPVQIRILTMTRKHLSPMEKYFANSSVESVLSDIFWASIKGDIGRVRHLVEVEGVSPTDSTLDPWNLHQTPLHWAAKGGSTSVIDYLLAAGANPRTLDENGSLPLHLSCWAGHVNGTLALLGGSDAKDLYVQDFDAAMCPLDWVNVRGHVQLLKAIEKYEDSRWLPKFVDDLIRGIVRYKIKLFKDPPKKLKREPSKAATTAGETAAPEPVAEAGASAAISESTDTTGQKDKALPPEGEVKPAKGKATTKKK